MNSDHLCFSFISVVTITLSITYKNFYPTRYTEYQEYLFNRIKTYKEQNVSNFGWNKIGDILNSEGLKTPMGKRFKSNNVHSIYTKGKNREERLNTEVEVGKLDGHQKRIAAKVVNFPFYDPSKSRVKA